MFTVPRVVTGIYPRIELLSRGAPKPNPLAILLAAVEGLTAQRGVRNEWGADTRPEIHAHWNTLQQSRLPFFPTPIISL